MQIYILLFDFSEYTHKIKINTRNIISIIITFNGAQRFVFFYFLPPSLSLSLSLSLSGLSQIKLVCNNISMGDPVHDNRGLYFAFF